ncbi:hypothetical protein TNCV_4868071 [Trichonephila clavipes]|nr:hypothetical protein TNCV_4868071 [Trichonephila clavipes]
MSMLKVLQLEWCGSSERCRPCHLTIFSSEFLLIFVDQRILVVMITDLWPALSSRRFGSQCDSLYHHVQRFMYVKPVVAQSPYADGIGKFGEWGEGSRVILIP